MYSSCLEVASIVLGNGADWTAFADWAMSLSVKIDALLKNAGQSVYRAYAEGRH